jgi:hypothetical protein
MDKSWQALIQSATGETVRNFSAVPHGANNRLFRVDCESGKRFAFKAYPTIDGDTRDRLSVEFKALRFLAGRAPGVVPAALACDKALGIALYEWIEGSMIEVPTADDIDATLNFIERLKKLGGDDDAGLFGDASEACFSFDDLLEQIKTRYGRLEAVSAQEPALEVFLKQQFDPHFRALTTSASEMLSGQAELRAVESRYRCLSASDFGFHNALKRLDGNLVFVDFEYFGWDDPVKLACDFLLHPGMDISTANGQQFREGTQRIFADDLSFVQRFDLYLPFYALRWCMILLNEFLPERWQRRLAAGTTEGIEDIKERQLLKAQAWLIKSKAAQEWKPAKAT